MRLRLDMPHFGRDPPGSSRDAATGADRRNGRSQSRAWLVLCLRSAGAAKTDRSMRRRGVGLLGMDTVLGPTGLAVRAGTWAQRDRWFLCADILRRPSAGKRPRETPAHKLHPSVCAGGKMIINIGLCIEDYFYRIIDVGLCL